LIIDSLFSFPGKSFNSSIIMGYEKHLPMLYTISMLRQIIQILLMILSISSCVMAQPNLENKNKDISSSEIDIYKHNQLKNLWDKANNSSYQLEVNYNAFSPRKGIWKIKVKDGILSGWEINNRINIETDKSFAIKFLQDHLYVLAEQAYEVDPDRLYITTVTYDPSGYIKEIVMKGNPDITSVKPTDKGFRIKINYIKF